MSKPQIIIHTPLHKRTWLVALIVAAICALGALGWYLLNLGADSSADSGNGQLASPADDGTLVPTTLYLEYSDKTIDPLKLVTCNDASATVTALDEIDLSSVGVQTVCYLITRNGSEETCQLDFTVRDTRVPAIVFANDEPAIDQDATFDPLANIKAVSDDVDGALPYRAIGPSASIAEPGLEVVYDEGWYTIDGEVHADTPGTYTLKVKATDKHGNVKARDMRVRVNPVANATSAGEGASHAYVLNTRSGVFHLPSCHSAHIIADKNRQDVEMTRDEVIEKGYRPCMNCNP